MKGPTSIFFAFKSYFWRRNY